jgi:peroxiredoxin Q/BCP
MELKIGDKAPLFMLLNQWGEAVSLADFSGKKNVVLFFYPKDFTPGCTKESCSFRDEYKNFTQLNCEVIGISNDAQNRHLQFASHYNLPYQLLSDKGNKVRKQYGVKAMLFGLLPGRVSFVIDKNGIIQHITNSQFNSRLHIDECLKAVELLLNSN